MFGGGRIFTAYLLDRSLCGYLHTYAFLNLYFIKDIEHLLLCIGHMKSGNEYLPTDSPMLGKADTMGARHSTL